MIHSVTYLEVAADRTAACAAQIARWAARQGISARPLQRIHPASHFAVLDECDESSAATGARAAAFASLRELIAAHLTGGWDERAHRVLAPDTRAVGPGSGRPLCLLTHVDFVPTHKDAGIATLLEFAAACRTAPGCIGFRVLQQADRGNHLTIDETWADEEAFDRHAAADVSRRFRETILPLSGSLFDQRHYRWIDRGPG